MFTSINSINLIWASFNGIEKVIPSIILVVVLVKFVNIIEKWLIDKFEI